MGLALWPKADPARVAIHILKVGSGLIHPAKINESILVDIGPSRVQELTVAVKEPKEQTSPSTPPLGAAW